MKFLTAMQFPSLLILTFIVAESLGKSTGRLETLETKIVGGRNTTIEEHPYQVAIEVQGQLICGGILIKPNIVITAAHCIGDDVTRTNLIRAGSTIREQGGEIRRVTNAIICPKYDNYKGDYDVSVLILSEPFKLSDKIGTIGLQDVNTNIPAGTLANVTGWGNTKFGGNLPRILQEVQVPKVINEVCNKAYVNTERNITDRMTCYAFKEGGKDACNGDSGGPLTVNGKLAGIVSWGKGCADPRYPGVYTNIVDKEIHDFITSNLNSRQ